MRLSAPGCAASRCLPASPPGRPLQLVGALEEEVAAGAADSRCVSLLQLVAQCAEAEAAGPAQQPRQAGQQQQWRRPASAEEAWALRTLLYQLRPHSQGLSCGLPLEPVFPPRHSYPLELAGEAMQRKAEGEFGDDCRPDRPVPLDMAAAEVLLLCGLQCKVQRQVEGLAAQGDMLLLPADLYSHYSVRHLAATAPDPGAAFSDEGRLLEKLRKDYWRMLTYGHPYSVTMALGASFHNCAGAMPQTRWAERDWGGV